MAIATALANRPKLLLGDEPTGELDSKTADEVMQLLRQMNERFGVTVIVVTHDAETAAAVDRVVRIRDGRTSSETVRRADRRDGSAVTDLDERTAAIQEMLVVDTAGRLQLPAELLEEANIGNRVTLERTEDGVLIKPVAGRENDVPLMGLDEDAPPEKVESRWRRFLKK